MYCTHRMAQSGESYDETLWLKGALFAHKMEILLIEAKLAGTPPAIED